MGERVQFQPDGHPPVTGVLTRYNRRTVTVIADTGQQWNVAPQFLQRIAPPATESVDSTQSGHARPQTAVVELKRRPSQS